MLRQYKIFHGLGILFSCVLLLNCFGCKNDNVVENIENNNQHGNYGYIDVNGDVVIEPQFYFAGNISEGLAPVAIDVDRYGYINRDGELRIPAQFNDARSFSEGLACVCSSDNGLWGYIDITGKYVIEPQYINANSFSEGLARVGGVGDDPMGFIDHKGNWVIPPILMGALTGGGFHDGRALMMDYRSNKFGFIDTAGNIVIEPTFEDASFFSEGLALVKENGKWGYIDVAGNWVIEPTFKSANSFSEGLADVKLEGDNGMTLINRQGVEILEIDYIRTGFSEGLAWVQKDGKLICINNFGETQIEYEQNNEPKQVSPFAEGLAAIEFL